MSYEREEDPYYNYGQDDPYAAPTAASPPPSADQSWRNPDGGRQYWDVDYWGRKGVSPDEMFDENGQIRPGWRRTEYGYDRDAAPPGNTPTPNQYPFGPPIPNTPFGGDGGGFSFGAPPEMRSLDSLWPSWQPPQWQGMTYTPPPLFSYAEFEAPSLADAEAEPGYAFAATQGRKQVEASKAAQGVYRSGQTLKDIYSWASEYAKQNYSGAFDRKLTTYGTNRNNAAENYMTNYGVSRDTFDRNYGSSRDTYDRGFNAYQSGFNSATRKAELDFGRDWDRYASDLDTKKFLVNAGND